MCNINSPQNILAAIKRVLNELPVLIGDKEWDVIGDSLLSNIHRLSTCSDSEERDIFDEIVKTLTPYNAARSRLRLEKAQQGVLQHHMVSHILDGDFNVDERIVPALAAVSHAKMKWTWDVNLSPEDMDRIAKELEKEEERTLKTSSRGIGGAKSIKFKNLHLDVGEISEIAGGTMLAAHGIIEKPHILVIVGGILLTIHALTRAMTVDIREQEASVFWGFILTRNSNNIAREDAILKTTNTEREHCGLEPLSDEQFHYSLIRLEQIKSIEPVPGRSGYWRIIERYEIQD